jgi:hypothetical protein
VGDNMETFKFKKEYLFINVLLIMLGIGLLCASFFISDKSIVYYIGIIDRIIFGICFIFNGIWNCSTDYYSLINNNKFHTDKKTAKWPWLLIIAIGVGMLVTAFMGYGFN